VKLSVITDEISQEFEHALDVMLEYGVHAAELRGLWGSNIGELTPEQVERAKRALSERGMAVSCLATPFYKCDLGEETASVAGQMHLARARGHGEQMALLERCCALAHAFGTPYIRVFTFWRRGELTPEIEARIVESFAEPIRIAEREGVTLVLENEHACFICTGAETGRVVRAIGSPRVRVCWDPGNALAAGERPYPDGYEAVRGLVDHVHVKDAALQPDGSPKWCVVGQGAVGYAGQIEALRTDGYTGHLSLETHYVPEGGTPEDGSRECLAALRDLVG